MAVVRHDFRGLAARLRAKQGGSTPKAEVLPPARRPGPFTTEARQVWESITSMRAFLEEHAAPGRARLMSAAERDEVDNVGSEFLAVCTKRLDALKASVEAAPALDRLTQPGTQHRAHMKGALTILYDQLAALSVHVESFRAAFAAEAMEMRGRDLVPVTLDHGGGASAAHSRGEQRGWEEVAGCELELGNLSAEQMQQLEHENAELLAELNSMVDEVRSVESKMLEISALSSAFAAKLSEQAQSIEHIQQDTLSASEYVRSGNKSLESAERHARDFRLLQLFFFVIAALTLLVADWWYS